MNRRNFLKGIIAASVGYVALPSLPAPDIMVAAPVRILTTEELIAALKPCIKALVDNITAPSPFFLKLKELGFIETGTPVYEPIIYS